MTTNTYLTFRQAVLHRRQVFCDYGDSARALCPHVLGHVGGKEAAVCYQFNNESLEGPAGGGEWLCVFLSGVSNVLTRKGDWHADGPWPQDFIEEIDVEAGG